jgi:hypothetical protein
MDTKNPQYNGNTQHPATNKKCYNHEQVGFIPRMTGWVNIQKSINAMHHNNRIKDKNTILSHRHSKVPGKLQYHFMI